MPSRLLAVLAAALALAAGCRAADLNGYTEPLPPLNYEREGSAQGFSVDLLRLIAHRAGLSVDIQVLPWPRAVATAAGDPKSVLFTLTRTPAREAQFRWIGPIARRRIVLYRLTDRPELHVAGFEDMRTMRTAVARESATAKALAERGLTPHLEQALNDETSMRMLLGRHVDAVAMLDFAAAWHAAQQGRGFRGLQAMMVLDDTHEYYFGLRADAPDELVQRLQKALEALRREGELDALTRRYLS